MPTFRITGPDGSTYNVTGPEGSTAEQALARVRAQQAAPKPAAPKAAAPRAAQGDLSRGQKEAQVRELVHRKMFMPSFMAGMSPGDSALFANGATLGFADRLRGVTEVAKNAIAAPFSSKIDFDPRAAYNRGFSGERKLVSDVRKYGGATGTLAEAAGTAVPMMAAGLPKVAEAGAPMVVRALSVAKSFVPTAVTGALTGVSESNDLTNLNEVGGNALRETGNAVAGDMLGRGLVRGGGAILRGITPTALSQSMKARGITPTIGDTIGGRAKNFEGRLTKMPIVGGAIRDFQGKQYGQMLRAASDEVLAPIGKVAPAVPPGRAMYAGTKDLADEAYRSAVSGISGPVDAPLLAAINAPPSLTAPQRVAYDDIINAEVMPRIQSGHLAGEDVQSLKEVLDGAIDDYKKAAGYRGLVAPLKKLREELLGFVERNSPDGGVAYRNARAAYGRAKVLQKAVEASKTDGIPTAHQLANAVRQNARKYNGDAYARGIAPLQGLSDEATQMLPTTIPDPGTAGQLGLLNLLAHPIRNGVPALAGAAASVPYTAPGNAALQALLVRRPDLVRRLGQQAPQLAAPFGMLGASTAINGGR